MPLARGSAFGISSCGVTDGKMRCRREPGPRSPPVGAACWNDQDSLRPPAGGFNRPILAHLLSERSTRRIVDELLQLLPHGFEVGKSAIHAGKANVRNLIHSSQLLHHYLADNGTGNFRLAERRDVLLDLFHDTFQLTYWQRSLFACLTNAYQDLLPIEPFPSPITLDNHHIIRLDPLIRAKAPVTALTLAATMDTIAKLARILYPRITMATIWTFHAWHALLYAYQRPARQGAGKTNPVGKLVS
jgi:hypothetical protein